MIDALLLASPFLYALAMWLVIRAICYLSKKWDRV